MSVSHLRIIPRPSVPFAAVVPVAAPVLPPEGQATSELAHLRKANPADIVLPVTRRWLAMLPASVRPVHLVARFPRIANLIAVEWDQRSMIEATFADLFTDRRGGRAGFPAEIRDELLLIRYHYCGERSTEEHA